VAAPWDIVYDKTADGDVPAFDYFVESCTTKLHAFLNAVLDAVAAAPPPAFSGGGHWEAMGGEMGGYFEAKAIGSDRRHHRLFCLLDGSDDPKEMERRGLPNKAIAVVTGLWKPNATLFSDNVYKGVRELGDDYLAQIPRRIAQPDDVDGFIERLQAKRADEQAAKQKKATRRAARKR
jgi:hypothetical protein